MSPNQETGACPDESFVLSIAPSPTSIDAGQTLSSTLSAQDPSLDWTSNGSISSNTADAIDIGLAHKSTDFRCKDGVASPDASIISTPELCYSVSRTHRTDRRIRMPPGQPVSCMLLRWLEEEASHDSNVWFHPTEQQSDDNNDRAECGDGEEVYLGESNGDRRETNEQGVPALDRLCLDEVEALMGIGAWAR